MSEIVQMLRHSPPSQYHQMHPTHLLRDLENVETLINCSIDSDLASLDVTDHFQCSVFTDSPFTNFSRSSADELSKVTAIVDQNQSLKKRKLEPDDVEVDSRKQRAEGDSGLVKPPNAKTRNRKSKSKPNTDPKSDYIHVRARRGQATDSHSLAERARREKIKKKMQYLQGLVPGCNNMTNKAAILEEIITYIMCLQREVEFLNMKLAASTTSVVDLKMDN